MLEIKLWQNKGLLPLGTVVVVFCAASAHQNINPKVARKVWFQRQTHRQSTELCTLHISSVRHAAKPAPDAAKPAPDAIV